ncbi:MAG TPA: beta-ketoacyl synthase N-terminal-like domain-containing protein [Flavobacterium sp.]
MQDPVSIMSIASVSPLGNSAEVVWNSYLHKKHHFLKRQMDEAQAWVAPLDTESAAECARLRLSNGKYKSLDNSVLYAMAASRRAVKAAGWKQGDSFGINIGSSRGATELFEKHHADFLSSGKANTLASPTTTLGNISSWVAHDLQSNGPEISHSITCSTALHALLNGLAWLKAGMANKFLVGGSEAPLTNFTVAQMQALKIYSREQEPYPSRALDLSKTSNSMILGEGAAVCCLENGKAKGALAYVSGVGYATEILSHSISISAEADCFQKSMRMALGETSPEDVDVIVMHAPGTVKGDLTEFRAIEKVFGKTRPLLTTNKWQTGHTFGASGALSMEMAILMLQNQQFIGIPFIDPGYAKGPIRNVLVNAVGFGGNAVSVLLGLPE